MRLFIFLFFCINHHYHRPGRRHHYHQHRQHYLNVVSSVSDVFFHMCGADTKHNSLSLSLPSSLQEDNGACIWLAERLTKSVISTKY